MSEEKPSFNLDTADTYASSSEVPWDKERAVPEHFIVDGKLTLVKRVRTKVTKDGLTTEVDEFSLGN